MGARSVMFFGGTNLQEESEGYSVLQRIGKQLGIFGVKVVTGALGGAMEAPAKGATSVEFGRAIGYTFLGLGCNSYINEAVDCSTLHGEALSPELQYGVRLGYLLSSDAFVVAEGNAGTLVEVMAIINFNCRGWKPQKKVVFIDSSGIWKKTLDALMKSGYVGESMMASVKIFSNPTQQIRDIIDWIDVENLNRGSD
jgi:predicted Rossmann-fold nucleotide-binding protein